MFQVTSAPKARSIWTRNILICGLLLVFGCFAWLVWPTPYRYDVMRSGSTAVPVRINRFSGEAERLTVNGWQSMQPSPTDIQKAVSLTPSELAKLTGTAFIEDYGWIKANIYNGNNFDLGHVTISVTITNADGTDVFTRDYRLSSSRGDAMESSEFIDTLNVPREFLAGSYPVPRLSDNESEIKRGKNDF